MPELSFGACGFGAFGPTFGPTFGSTLGQAGNTPASLSKQQLTQNSSISISPYVLHRFGDTGTAKIGYELNQTAISPSGGSVPLFFPTGSSSQHALTNEAVAQFETGDRFAPFRNLLLQCLNPIANQVGRLLSDAKQLPMLVAQIFAQTEDSR